MNPHMTGEDAGGSCEDPLEGGSVVLRLNSSRKAMASALPVAPETDTTVDALTSLATPEPAVATDGSTLFPP